MEVKKGAKENLFSYMSDIVQLVISFDFQVTVGVSSNEKELKFSQIVDAARTDKPRLGLMKLAALELIDKLQNCYGLRMLEVFRDADIFSSLLKMYALYPFNDIALRHVTNVISYALDPELAKAMGTKHIAPKSQMRILELKMGMQSEEVSAPEEPEPPLENEQERKDQQIVYMIYQTTLVDDIIAMCGERATLSYDLSKNKIEMGYVAHLGHLGHLLLKLADKNEVIREQLEENELWMFFEKTSLKPRIEKREGQLCSQKQFGKQKESRFLSMFDDDEDEGDAPIPDLLGLEGVYGTGLAD